MTTVIAFLVGLLVGATGTFILIASTYGTDADDYYGEDRKPWKK